MRCPHCGEMTDVDEVSDGSEVVCMECDKASALTAFTDGSWCLVKYDDEEEGQE